MTRKWHAVEEIRSTNSRPDRDVQDGLRILKKQREEILLTGFRTRARYIKNAFISRMHDEEDHLIYIHIGKCGGKSLWEAIKESEVVKRNFSIVSKIHIVRPPVAKRSQYLIVLRNPVSRSMSAFNWRYNIVIERGLQKDRFPGEREVLRKYRNLNNIAEALYKNGRLCEDVAEEFRLIHHLREDIGFYLSGLLCKIDESQIFAVLATENLDNDVMRILNINKVERAHRNSSDELPNTFLSQVAVANLKKFLSSDFDVIVKISNLYKFEEATLAMLLK